MTPLLDITALDGSGIRRWSGVEMAITEDPLCWRHPDIPCLQMVDLQLLLDDGRSLLLTAQLEDGSGCHGLYLWPDAKPAQEPAEAAASIYRFRELNELPTGRARLTHIVRDGPNAVIEVELRIGGDEVRLLCGEVHEQFDGGLRMICPDESILIQLNARHPMQQSGNSLPG